MSLAVVIIPNPKRRETTFRRCLESVRNARPDEIVVVADFPVEAKGVRSLIVPDMTKTTCDALVKRDVGYLATQSTHVCFLADDHVLAEGFMDAWRLIWEPRITEWEVLVPSRFCWRNDFEHVAFYQQWLPVGQDHDYAAGHAAIYSRKCAFIQPWAATYHHPNWDVLHSRQLQARGCRFEYAGHDLSVEDIEGGEPWHMTEEQRAVTEAFHRTIKGRVA